MYLNKFDLHFFLLMIKYTYSNAESSHSYRYKIF